jgi:hypothetical protein
VPRVRAGQSTGNRQTLYRKEKILMMAMARFAIMVTAAASIFVSGCYEPAPVYAPVSQPSSFDRSWNAALGAMQDVGVRIQSEDRTRGVITGANDSRNVTINVMTQADGRVRVEISARGPQGGDTHLANDISRAYDRRMGR